MEQIEKCIGCSYYSPDTATCSKYSFPAYQHTRIGGCAMRTHDKSKGQDKPGFVDPLKASRKKARGKKTK